MHDGIRVCGNEPGLRAVGRGGADNGRGNGISPRAVIVGAGIGGLSAAIALRLAGWQTTIYESKTEVRPAGAGLGLGPNAVRALEKLGIGAELARCSCELDELLIATHRGRTITRTNFAEVGHLYGGGNVAVERKHLLSLLLNALGGQAVLTNRKVTEIRLSDRGASAIMADGGSDEGDLLIAADGLRSTIRERLAPHARPRYAGYTCWRAVVDADPQWRYNRRSFVETWGTKGRFGLVPLAGERIYWFACINAPEGDAACARMTASDLAALFKLYQEPIPQLLAETPDEAILHHDLYDLPPLRRYVYGRVVLLGDAAHAATPNMGQGAGQAIEDAVMLGRELRRRPGDIEAALRHYEKLRVPRTRRITQRSAQLGRVAQIDRPWLAAARDLLLPLLPASAAHRQLREIYGVDLEG